MIVGGSKGDKLMKSKPLPLAIVLFFSSALLMFWPVATEAQEQARFRVTLTGFRVNNATTESVISTDGAGDEVFALVNFAELWSSNNIFGALQRRQSLVYGDISGHRAPVAVT